MLSLVSKRKVDMSNSEADLRQKIPIKLNLIKLGINICKRKQIVLSSKSIFKVRKLDQKKT